MKTVWLSLPLACFLALPFDAQSTIDVPGTMGLSIQDGLDLALPGDTVLVAPGTYFECDLDFAGKDVTLRSAAGPATTIIDAQSLGRIFHFTLGETAAAVVEGFTLEHALGLLTPDGNGFAGGAVRIESSSPTFRDCVLRDNVAADGVLTTPAGGHGGAGGALRLADSNSLFEDCVFENNRSGVGPVAVGFGGAVAATGGAPRFESCVFTNNVASDALVPLVAGGSGGAMYLFDSDVTLLDCLFENNRTGNSGDEIEGGSGGGLYVVNGTVEIQRCRFLGNVCGDGGDGDPVGIPSQGSGGDGAGLHLFQSGSPTPPQLTLRACQFLDNQAGKGGDGSVGRLGGIGGAIYARTLNQGLRLFDTVIARNHGGDGGAGTTMGGRGGSGGAIFLEGFGEALRLMNVTMVENESGQGGPGPVPGATGSTGGLLPVLVAPSVAVVRNCIVRDNVPLNFGDTSHLALAFTNTPGVAGTGNIDADPLFVAADDYHLAPGSPCIDAGTSTPFSPVSELDFEGDPRVLCAGPDMGADEFGVLAAEVVRLGTPPNPADFQPGLSGPPVLGNVWDPLVTSTLPGAILAFAAIGAVPMNVPTSLGTLLCNVPPPSFLFLQPAGLPFAIPIPPDCALAGLQRCVQGGSLAIGPVIQLANALDVTIGTH